MKKSYNFKNGKKNIARGTTDTGVKCFHQSNGLKNHAPLLKQRYNLFHIIRSLLTFSRRNLEIPGQQAVGSRLQAEHFLKTGTLVHSHFLFRLRRL